MPDEDGYPTEEELAAITAWEASKDIAGWLALCRAAWHYPEGWPEAKDGVHTIATGGWSGNEEILNAMRKNLVMWAMSWVESTRGGRYVFAENSEAAEFYLKYG